MKKNILIFLHSIGRNGANQVIYDIIINNNYNCYIILPKNQELYQSENSDMLNEFNTIKDLNIIYLDYYNLPSDIFLENIDIILVNCFMRGDIIYKLKSINWNKSVIWFRGDFFS